MPGKARLARHILGSALEARDVQISGLYGLKFLTPSLREPIGFHLLVDGIYEPKAVEFVLRQLNPGSVFVDVGANIGVFALPAARKVGPYGRVFAIDPSPIVFPYLAQNVERNQLTNVHIVQCAAFDKNDATVSFYEAPMTHFGMGSLGPQFHSSPIPVPTRTLDSLMEEHGIPHIDVMKIDVEGAEAAALHGAEKILTGNHPPVVVFEFCDWAEKRITDNQVGDAQRLLAEWGFRIWRLKDFLNKKAQLTAALTEGFDTLIATRNV